MCYIDSCRNEEYQGEFNGQLCKPCYTDLLSFIDSVYHSIAMKNMQEQAKNILRENEIYKAKQMYR